MKKVIYVLFLALLVFGNRNTVNAADEVTSEVTSVTTEATSEPVDSEVQNTTDSAKPKNPYILPFPGMLVDNRMYFIKHIRDVIMEALISDPTKKTEFYILQSDKFLAMSSVYGAMGKWEMVSNVLNRSEVNMDKGIAQLVNVKAYGAVPSYLTTRISESLIKHAEVIDELKTKAPEKEKTTLDKKAAAFLEKETLVSQYKQ